MLINSLIYRIPAFSLMSKRLAAVIRKKKSLLTDRNLEQNWTHGGRPSPLTAEFMFIMV